MHPEIKDIKLLPELLCVRIGGTNVTIEDAGVSVHSCVQSYLGFFACMQWLAAEEKETLPRFLTTSEMNGKFGAIETDPCR